MCRKGGAEEREKGRRLADGMNQHDSAGFDRALVELSLVILPVSPTCVISRVSDRNCIEIK